MHPTAFRSVPVPTAFGIPLELDERVVFVRHPAPVTTGQRVPLLLFGIVLIPALIGIYMIYYALTNQSDRVWFVTSRRAFNITAKGKIRERVLANVRHAKRDKNADTVELGIGYGTVLLPLLVPIHGVHMLAFARNPTQAANMPTVDAPP